MGKGLARRIKQTRPLPPSEEALLNLMIAADHIRARIDRACGNFGITNGQYNVLRILRGAYPDGHARREIATRMLERAPDVTRLVDRLEAQGLVERSRAEQDRRLSISRITETGLDLLERMAPAIDEVNRYFGKRVSRRDCRELTRICEGLYGEE